MFYFNWFEILAKAKKDQKIAKQVEWKINRAFVFKGIPNTTWHSYANTQDTPRLTINYFEL